MTTAAAAPTLEQQFNALRASGKTEAEALAEIAARGRPSAEGRPAAEIKPEVKPAEPSPAVDPYATIKREHGYDVAPFDGKESPELADARRVAESLGLKFQPVTEATGQLRGATINGTVYVRADLTGDALWATVGHEIGHGIKAEELGVFPQEMLDRAAEARKSRAS